MNTCRCFVFRLDQLVSDFIINYTCYYLTEKGELGALGFTLDPSMDMVFLNHELLAKFLGSNA